MVFPCNGHCIPKVLVCLGLPMKDDGRMTFLPGLISSDDASGNFYTANNPEDIRSEIHLSNSWKTCFNFSYDIYQRSGLKRMQRPYKAEAASESAASYR